MIFDIELNAGDYEYFSFNLNKDEQNEVKKTLQDFCTRAVSKYIAGSKEHGGKITDRDCLKEMHDEIIDLMFYHAGVVKQLKLKQDKE